MLFVGVGRFASLTMMVLKLSIMAPRAEDSQHTLVTVLVISTVSRPCARNRCGRSDEAPARMR